MPGPPPPSKSYLLKFDSSSEEEEEDYYQQPAAAAPVPIQASNTPRTEEPLKQTRQYPQPPPPAVVPTQASNISSRNEEFRKEILRRQGNNESVPNPNADLIEMLKSYGGVSNIEETPKKANNNNAQISTIQIETTSPDDDAAASTADTTTTTTKKKKKKKRKKKKKNSTATTSTNAKKVSFSKIHVAEFQRDIYGDAVPYDGGWPLALSNKLHREFSLDIDSFEMNKQIELKHRYEKYVIDRRKKKSSSSGSSSSSSSSRRKRSNSKTAEELKKKEQVLHQKSSASDLLLPVFTPEHHIWETRQFDYRKHYSDKRREEGKDPKLEFNEIHGVGKNALFGELFESERKHLFARDVTSSSSSKSSSSSCEDMFCSQEIIYIRNELEQLRIHRSAENAAGCSCRKLHVVLPSELNGGKKSHHHRRLTERRVKEELRRRHVSFQTNAKRDELEQLLHDTVEQQGCCYGNDCPCAKSGIECQSNTCSCWHTSHITHHSHKKDKDVCPAELKIRCGNKNGIYAVDFDQIAKHRGLFCKSKDSAEVSS